MIYLIRVEPEQNLNRWYAVGVQPTLFDDCAVICAWGRRGTDYARWRIIPAVSLQQARHQAEQIVARKIRRGYRQCA